MKNELFAKLPTITSEEITEKVGAAKAKAETYAVTAKDYFEKVTEPVKETKIVAKLAEDIEENPKKVAAEAGISAAVGAAVFAGLRIWDAYKDGVKKPEPELIEGEVEFIEKYGPADFAEEYYE